MNTYNYVKQGLNWSVSILVPKSLIHEIYSWTYTSHLMEEVCTITSGIITQLICHLSMAIPALLQSIFPRGGGPAVHKWHPSHWWALTRLNSTRRKSADASSHTYNNIYRIFHRVYHIVTDHSFWVESIMMYHETFFKKRYPIVTDNFVNL